VSEAAAELPISEAREQLTDVVNRAVYAGEATYITRRGRRLAVVTSAAQLEADRARARQQAVLDTCRRLWAEVLSTSDGAARDYVRSILDRIIEDAEDLADQTVVRAVDEDTEQGSEPIPWDQVKADLGL
jgi:prevent-host-death family protein